KVVFLNVADPEHPSVITDAAGRPLEVFRKGIKGGAAALTSLPDGRFLLGVWTDSDPRPPRKHLDLYLSRGTDLFQGFEPKPRRLIKPVAALPRFQTIDFL